MTKQIIVQEDTFGEAFTKQNENNTELYDRENTPLSNNIEFLYVKGNETTDGSLRFSVDATTNFIKAEQRISGVWERTNQELRAIDYDTTLGIPTYKEGRMLYDNVSKTHVADTGYDNVRNCLGRENHIEVYNGTATTINNGDPVSVNGIVTSNLPNVEPVDINNILSVLGFAGVATMTIPPGESGIVTNFGLVHNVNTGTLTQGFIYADDVETYTQTRPSYPKNRLIVGAVIKTGVTDGIISVYSQFIKRTVASRNYTFSSADAGAGRHWRAGFYDWASTSTTRTQSSPSITYGTPLATRAAHVGIVAQGPGSVDSGVVGLRVTGIMDSENGPQTAAQTAIITEDITTLSANSMTECLEKFSGEVTIELYVVSGAPTTYSLTFNYGYSKYEDFANIDGTVTAFSAVWSSGANDTGFDVSLKFHNDVGWQYAASNFVAGNGNICNRLTDQALAPNLTTNGEGAYKRTNLNQFVSGSGREGIIIEIVTSVPGTINNMDMSVTAYSEELF